MKIAMFGSAEYPISPDKEKTIYAPLQVLEWIANEMVKRGHDVTVFCAEGSKIKAKSKTFGLKPLSLLLKKYDLLIPRGEFSYSAYEQVLIAELYRQANKFDIIHIHPVILGLPFASLVQVPTVFTLHDPIMDKQRLIFPLYNKFPQIYYVSLSNAQRKNLPNIRWISTVYNGIEVENFTFSPKRGKYLAWAGRIVPEKGADIAIQVAKETKIPLRIAGQYYPDSPSDFEYWQKKIKPDLKTNLISYAGLMPYGNLPAFYQNALVLLNPINWEEPFGLVPVEANACGTPVVAFARGSMSELIKDGVNGFLVKPGDIDGMVKAVKKIYEMPEEKYRAMRRACRRHVEENFTVEKMVDGYEAVYQKVIKDYRKRHKGLKAEKLKG